LSLANKIARSLTRDADLPIAERIKKGARFVAASISAPLHLRHCTTVGRRARTIGAPNVENGGTIEIGNDVVLNSQFSPVELIAVAGGKIQLGENVRINFGTTVNASRLVSIADDVSIGPYCIIADSEIPGVSDTAAPIEIEAGVWLAGRVTVLPGTRIGAGSVITAGSIVSGDIPANVVAGGIPARTLRSLADPIPSPETSASDVRETHPAKIGAHSYGGSVPLAGVVLADFTIGDLGVRLADPRDEPAMTVASAPFCQTTQMLLQGPPQDGHDFLVVWTRPELVSSAFDRILQSRAASAAELEADVDAFCQLLIRGAEPYRFAFVATWTLPPNQRGRGLLDARDGGATWALSIMNRRLMLQLGGATKIFVLDAQRWIAASGSGRRPTAKGWYLGKVPFHSEVFAEAARDVKAAARAVLGQSRKLLILDLDDTLWGGIVGDVGWENLQLGGHDGVGEAFADFQRAVQSLARRGILLGIVSKNTESVALEAFRSHSEMILKLEDFAGWRINWEDKARNVLDLANELNLGLQSVVFIDDSALERARVREALPEVLVPEWPSDKLLYPSALAALTCFDAVAITQEDKDRTRLYAEERERSQQRQKVGSMEDWLASLGIRVDVEPLGAANLARASQLLNKTNQMNLTTRRLTEAELAEWATHADRALLTFSVSDRFGTAGLTGLLGLEASGSDCRIVDFVLSCRVMGRRIEETMAYVAVEWARARDLKSVYAQLIPTKKNQPCLEFWNRSGFTRVDGDSPFTWDAMREYGLPECIATNWTENAVV
jgi:FkbH-like protein